MSRPTPPGYPTPLPGPLTFVPDDVSLSGEPALVITDWVDRTLDAYADILQGIYDRRTAGDFTFKGVLADFLFSLKHPEPEED